MDKLEELLNAFETAIINYNYYDYETTNKHILELKLELELKIKNAKDNIIEYATELKNTEYYFNTLDGSMIGINWLQNRPAGSNWVSITKECYEVHK